MEKNTEIKIGSLCRVEQLMTELENVKLYDKELIIIFKKSSTGLSLNISRTDEFHKSYDNAIRIQKKMLEILGDLNEFYKGDNSSIALEAIRPFAEKIAAIARADATG